MKQHSDSSKNKPKPAKALPVKGGVVNRTDGWQRADAGAESLPEEEVASKPGQAPAKDSSGRR